MSIHVNVKLEMFLLNILSIDVVGPGTASSEKDKHY